MEDCIDKGASAFIAPSASPASRADTALELNTSANDMICRVLALRIASASRTKNATAANTRPIATEVAVKKRSLDLIDQSARRMITGVHPSGDFAVVRDCTIGMVGCGFASRGLFDGPRKTRVNEAHFLLGP